MPARERKHGDGLPVEILDRPQRTVAARCPDIALVAHERAVENERAALGRHSREAQFLDELPERIVADGLVGVALRDAGLVHHRRSLELAGLNLAAQTMARLEQRDPARWAESPFQQTRRHQAARPTTDDRDSGHAAPCPLPTQGRPGTGHGVSSQLGGQILYFNIPGMLKYEI